MQIEQDVPLGPLTTLRIGGTARFFARATSEPELLEAVRFAGSRALPLFVLGGGSNLLVPDHGFPGLVLHIALPPSILRTDTPGSALFDVSAGTDWDALVLHLCQSSLAGMECLAGIPGLVGGSPIQNIGAYGQEVSQSIESVRALDLQSLIFVTLSAADCRFRYRTSIFNSTHRGRYIVSSVRFRLTPGTLPNLTYADLKKHFAAHPNPTPLEVYRAVRTIRRTKGMLLLPGDAISADPDFRSAGSFFKNPIVPPETLTHIASALSLPPDLIPHWPTPDGSLKLPAAWLIEQAGFPKGFSPCSDSPVAISTRHTLALVNRTGTATCADLLALRDLIISTVHSRFAVTLEQEPILLA